MSEEKVIPTLLYTTEAEELKKEVEKELKQEDPEESVASEILSEAEIE